MRRTLRMVAIATGLSVVLAPLPTTGAVGDEVSVSGRVWQDTNADGLRAPAEPALAGIVVLLFEGAAAVGPSTPLGETTTDASGEYTFEALVAGEYHVRFRPPGDTALTYRDVGDDDAVDSDPDPFTGRTEPVTLDGGSIGSLDAGLLRIPDFTLIGGWVWEDWDDDGIQDRADESPLGGVTVRLLRETPPPARRRGRGGRRGAARQPTFEMVRSTTSSAFDGYVFYVTPGRARYRVEVVPPDDYATVPRDQGLDDVFDSDVEPGSRRSDPFNAAADRSIDIGLAPLSHIADRAWLDADGDGIQDPDERGLPDVFALLYRFDEQANVFDLEDFDVTDDAGSYAFGPRRPGRYRVQFVPSAGHGFSMFQAGDDPSLDSDAMEDSGATPDILLPDDAVSADEVALRRLVAGLAGAFVGLARFRADRPAQDVELSVGGVAGAASPFSLGPFFTPIWDAGLIPGAGLPEVAVGVDERPVICGSDRRVTDQEVTISGVRVVRLPNGDRVVLISMAKGLQKDYSFAVLLHVRTPLGNISFVWEIHDKDLRIGQVDPQTGEVIRPSGEGLQILHQPDPGLVAFVLSGGLISDDADVAAVQSFHSPNRRSMTRCHGTPTIQLPRP